MNIELAKTLLKDRLNDKGELGSNTIDYIPKNGKLRLDSLYSLQELEAIVFWVKNDLPIEDGVRL